MPLSLVILDCREQKNEYPVFEHRIFQVPLNAAMAVKYSLGLIFDKWLRSWFSELRCLTVCCIY